MNARLGWFFCEAAFLGWDWLGEAAYTTGASGIRVKWWAWLPDRLLSAAYTIGCWFYRRASA